MTPTPRPEAEAAAEQYANCLRNATRGEDGSIHLSGAVADGMAATFDVLRGERS